MLAPLLPQELSEIALKLRRENHPDGAALAATLAHALERLDALEGELATLRMIAARP